MRRIVILLAMLVIAAFSFGQQGTDKDKATLAKAEKAYTALKANFTKHPKDAKAKKEYVAATVAYGHESMINPSLGPRVKYRQALKLYREALKLDPTNKVAKEESEMIIKIYKDMGRPVPGD